jgi:hypothetical protein
MVYGNLVEEMGAVIMGRRSYDNSIEAWGGKSPLRLRRGGGLRVPGTGRLRLSAGSPPARGCRRAPHPPVG